MDDIVTYLIVTCDDKTFVISDERMTHQKGLHETITFILEVRGLKVVTRIKISQNAVADSNVSVTISPSMIIQALVCLARRKRLFPKAPWLLMINRSFVSFAASQLTSYM